MIEDIILNFDDYANQLDPDEVYKNSDIILKQAKGKYIILTIHVIHIDSFDDPEMSLTMSIVNGCQNESFREKIFSSEVTHISVCNKKLGENQRMIYYILAKRL